MERRKTGPYIPALAVRLSILEPGGPPVRKRHEELIQSIAADDAFRVRALLSEDPDLVTARDPHGRTAILLALYFGHEELARRIRETHPAPDLFEAAALGEPGLLGTHLQEHPEGANAVAPDGFGPLGLAVYFGRLEAARTLLQAGASPETPSSNEFKVRPLHSAAAHRDPEVSLALGRLLLEWHADPNVVQAGGWTPLHQAAAHGRREFAELLLAHGARTDVRSDDGRTPAEMARKKGHEELGALLDR